MTLFVSQMLEGIFAFVSGWLFHKSYVAIRYGYRDGMDVKEIVSDAAMWQAASGMFKR